MAGKRLELLGKSFGSLIVMSLHDVHPKHGTIWECQCVCGDTHIVRGSHLTAGTVHQCTSCKFLASRNPNGVGDMSVHYWHQICRGANRRGLVIDVTHKSVYQLFLDQNRKCALSGVLLWFPKRTNQPVTGNASLDRIDSNMGYVDGNIQWVHKIVNRLKMDLSEEELIQWCNNITNHSQQVPL